ncbi:MAG: DUF1016 family protein [Methanospirillaceae archaeon]|nr:DUF1016 family protein [Methanospirillaceae archaeon]
MNGMNFYPFQNFVTPRVANSLSQQDVRMCDDLCITPDDNPTISLIHCTDTTERVARYSILHEQKQIFASKYMLYLSSEEEQTAEIIWERKLSEGKEMS